MSSQSELPKTPSIPYLDKIAHTILYAGLAFVVSLGIWRSNEHVVPKIQFIIPIAFATLYGISDEIHQIFVPNRSFEIADILVDFLGATIIQFILCGWLWNFIEDRWQASNR